MDPMFEAKYKEAESWFKLSELLIAIVGFSMVAISITVSSIYNTANLLIQSLEMKQTEMMTNLTQSFLDFINTSKNTLFYFIAIAFVAAILAALFWYVGHRIIMETNEKIKNSRKKQLEVR